MTGKYGRNNWVFQSAQEQLDCIALELNRRAVLEAEEKRRKEARVTLEHFKGAFADFYEIINRETLDEAGTADMAKNLAGYEVHGHYVVKEAVRNQLGFNKELGSAPELLEAEDHEKLLSIITLQVKPTGTLKDIIGAEDVKHILYQQWFLPMKFPNYFTGDRRPWDSILLYGLAGTGKTTLARVLAAELKAPFLRVIGHRLRSENYGESEAAIRNLFTLAKENAPSVLLIDDVEGLFPCAARGDRSLTARISYEFFNQIEQMAHSPKSVIVLAATNKPNRMDKESLDKFEKVVYLEPPTFGDRARIFKRNLANAEHVLTETDLEVLARRTEGYTGGDLVRVIRNARMKPLSELASAFHFKNIDSPSMMGEGGIKPYWTACDAKDKSGLQMTWHDIPDPEDVIIPKLTMSRVFQAVLRVKPSSTGISNDKITAFRRGLVNEYIIHEIDDREDTSFNHLRENRKWYDCFLECFVG